MGGFARGGGSQGGGGGGGDPLLPHAYLQGGCVSGAGLGKLLVAVVKQGLQMGRCVHSGCGDLSLCNKRHSLSASSSAQNMDGLMKGKHAQKNLSAVGAMAPTPLSLKTREGGLGGVAYKDQARPPPPPWLQHQPRDDTLHWSNCIHQRHRDVPPGKSMPEALSGLAFLNRVSPLPPNFGPHCLPSGHVWNLETGLQLSWVHAPASPDPLADQPSSRSAHLPVSVLLAVPIQDRDKVPHPPPPWRRHHQKHRKHRSHQAAVLAQGGQVCMREIGPGSKNRFTG